MPRPGAVERPSDRWASAILSVLLHGALVVAVAYGWWFYRHDRPAPTLAIDATVVDARTVPGLGNLPPQPQPPAPPVPQPPPPQPQDTQPQVEPEGPPQPTPEELAKREQEQKEEADRQRARQQEEDQKRLEQERQQEEALAQEKAAEQKRAEEQRIAAEQEQKRAAEKAEAERKAAEKAEAERKAREAAEAKKRDEEKRAAEQRARDEQQAKAEREADLRRSLDQELQQDAAQRSGALASWTSQITARIQRAWLKPPSARPGIECVLDVTQAPGGEVTNVRIGTCNGDQAVRESIEAAVYRASPLPPPPDPALFQRELVITFRPN